MRHPDPFGYNRGDAILSAYHRERGPFNRDLSPAASERSQQGLESQGWCSQWTAPNDENPGSANLPPILCAISGRLLSGGATS